MVTVVVVRRWNMAITVSVDTLLQHGMFFFKIVAADDRGTKNEFGEANLSARKTCSDTRTR